MLAVVAIGLAGTPLAGKALAQGVTSQIVVFGGSELDPNMHPPADLGEVVAICNGDYHCLALRADGTVVGWGDNLHGQATPPAGLSNVVAISAGGTHSLALKSDGTVVGWGYNGNHQVDTVAGLSNVVAIDAAQYYNLALKADGTLVALANKDLYPPPGLSNVVAVSGAWEHALALKADGTVVAWGSNQYGQTNVPVGLSNIVAIAAGDRHSLALGADGKVRAWGSTNYGATVVPQGLSNVIAIGANWGESLALKADGTLVVWGYGSNALAGLSNVVAIAADFAFSMALLGSERVPLSVRRNGAGGVNPNYDGERLLVGRTYSMTASNGNGFVFSGWTSNLLPNDKRPTITFSMHPNLMLTANFTDVQAPELGIDYPVSGDLVMTTNGLVEVHGTAGDNAQIAAVRCQLNDGAWIEANSVDNWTNWNVTLPMPVGTNLVRVVAVDASGLYSITNAVIFQHGTGSVLTLRVKGNGTVAGAKDGQILEVGRRYTLTATPAPGCIFRSWRDASGTVLGSTPTFSFIMRSNRVLVARFADTQAPTLAIGFPTNGARVYTNNGLVRVRGIARDNVQVIGVKVRWNNGAWTEATTGNNWSNWSVTLPMQVGTNVFRAYAYDRSGRCSTTNSVRFQYVVASPLRLEISGKGTVSGATPGQLLEVGRVYTLAAVPAPGFTFAGWSGGVSKTNNPFRFTMRSNLWVVANFADVQAPEIRITSPITNSRLMAVNKLLQVRGETSDNCQVTNVCYQLNDGAWTNAVTTNNWTEWWADIAPQWGGNRVQAYALDSGGNRSTTNSVDFEWVPTNDNFADAIPLHGTNYEFATVTSYATVEPGEPSHGNGVDIYASLWWVWTAPGDGLVRLRVTSAFEWPLIGGYEGESVSNLTTVASGWGRYETSAVFQARRGHVYHIAVAGGYGTAGGFGFTMAFKPAPENDAFSNATVIPSSAGVLAGSTDGAGIEPGEPSNHANTVWWRWTAPINGQVTLSCDETYIWMLLSVYAGDSLDQLIHIAGGAYSYYAGMQPVTFNAQAGTTYSIAVDGHTGWVYENYYHGFVNGRGPFQLRLELARVTLISPTNGSRFVAPSNVTLVASPDDVNHTVARLEILDGNQSLGVVTNAPYSLAWANPPIGEHTLLARVTDGEGITYDSAQVRVRFSPTNDDFSNRTFVMGTNVTVAGWVSGATREPGEPEHQHWWKGSNSVWYCWTAPMEGTLSITPSGLGPIIMDAFRGNSLSNLSRISGNGPRAMQFPVLAGESYQIRIDSDRGYPGEFSLQFNFETETSQPVSVTVLPAATIVRNLAHQVDGGFRFSLSGQAGQVFLIQASSNLADWVTLKTVTMADGVVDFVDPEAKQFPNRFYRAIPQSPL